MDEIGEKLALIKKRIADASARVGRDPDSVRIVSVSKTKPLSSIEKAVRAGVEILGENYVQEAISKIEKSTLPVSWHFIGHLQSNKARKVVPYFAMIHSVDSFKLAGEISRCALNEGKIMDILIQVNVSGEDAKFGIRPSELSGLLKEISPLKGVRVRGLMTMPPYFDAPERARPFFRDLKNLAAEMKHIVPGVAMDELSMGMSGDFETAVEEGATLVRIGTSIFGQRDYS